MTTATTALKKFLTVVVLIVGFATASFAQKVGQTAPNITMQDPNGNTLSLKGLRGKVVLVDFWASWCGPCRAENPNLVKCYAKYKDMKCSRGNGFEIFSVSLDVKQERWEKAIKADKLTWKWHVCDLSGWQNKAAVAYGVTGLPSNFLIDKDGRIIAANLHGESLAAILKGVFGE